MQNLDQQADTLYKLQPNNYRLQKGDIVGVDIKVATDNPILKTVFPPSTTPNMGGSQGVADLYYLTGYALNDSGYIILPVVGKITLEGKTLFEANQIVQSKFDEYLANVFITVRFGGLRFSALGEVNAPGKYVVLQNRVTIFEAIAVAGDLTILAKRNKVLLLRQYPDGSRLHELDLLDEKIVTSPFYYIQPNDLIYVEPMKIRSLGTGETAVGTITSILAALASTLLIINLLK